MIEEIAIHGLGVIDEATLPLGPGFTALTGETGAGKTMVVTALGLLIGQRADSGVVRAQGSAEVEGRWLLPVDDPAVDTVREAGGIVDETADGAELLVTRTLNAAGRSRATMGAHSVPVGLLAEAGAGLVAIHGQSDQLRLRTAAARRRALDAYGGEGVAEASARYSQAYGIWREHTAELARLGDERDTRHREAEFLRDALARIEAVAPESGEDVRLADQAERLGNLEELRTAALTAREAISAQETDGGDVLSLLGHAGAVLERAAGHDPGLAGLTEAIRSLEYAAADAAAGLSSYLDALEPGSEQELDDLQTRRAALAALQRSFGPNLEDVLTLATEAPERLAGLEGDDERIIALDRLIQDEKAELAAAAAELSARRRTAAGGLGEAVTVELARLAMPEAHLVVEVTERDDYTAEGKDAVQMLLSPHRGAAARPLGRGASGGELSRVMLAIEVVLAQTDPVPTLVFDEIDQGVGGAVAIEIGRLLARLARHTQVIVVTHLAQVAAFATNHLTVVKDESGALTASSVRRLEGPERVAEITRLLSGLTGSQSGARHARELLETAAGL